MTEKMQKTNKTSRAKPFIKWAGGKTQLLEEIERRIPSDFKRNAKTYVEPFVGGGSVMFWILQQYPNISYAVINDINPKLINTYIEIRDNAQQLIELLQDLQKTYILLCQEERKKFFVEQRKLFNQNSSLGTEQAARFIFLNRTCFNGLYRENSKGEFNVPHGKYTNPLICDNANLNAVSEILKRVEILCGDFSQTLKYAGNNTLFYFDPPYKPLNATSSFNNYVKGNFGDSEQVRLRNFCNEITKRGSNFILSNSDVKNNDKQDDFFDNLYSAYNIGRVMANRMVNANPSKRGKLKELMITNYQATNSERFVL